MVSSADIVTVLYGRALLAAEDAQPLIQQLEPAMRAKVLAALAGLVILGIAMVVFAWWGARATRRYMNQAAWRTRRTPAAEEDWANKPLVNDDEE